MAHRKQKAKIAKGLAIASALILLVTFIVKEILKDNIKELHDSLASAETQFRNESGQSTISMQILITQQQIENLRLEAEGARNDPNHDYSALIAQDTLAAQQAQTHLDVDFDSISRLIDRLPGGARDLRQQRDQMRAQMEKIDKQVKDMLKPKPDHDVWRFVQVKSAMAMALLEDLPVIVLGDAVLTRAKRVQEAAETLIRMCARAVYVLSLLGLALGLYAAVTGIKTEAAE
jgi:hypothetical protein